ncbi:MAG: hypothetical protein OHK0039_07680 [Bacteroidia bacterium]
MDPTASLKPAPDTTPSPPPTWDTPVRELVAALDAQTHEAYHSALFVLLDAYRGLAAASRQIFIGHATQSPGSTGRQRTDELLSDLERLRAAFDAEHPELSARYLQAGVSAIRSGIDHLILRQPLVWRGVYTAAHRAATPGDPPPIRRARRWQRLRYRIGRRDPHFRIPFQRVVAGEFQRFYLPNFYAFLQALTIQSYQVVQDLCMLWRDAAGLLHNHWHGTGTATVQVVLRFDAFFDQLDKIAVGIAAFLPDLNRQLGQRIQEAMYRPGIRHTLHRAGSYAAQTDAQIAGFSRLWQTSQEALHEDLRLCVSLLGVRAQFRWLADQTAAEIGLRCFEAPEQVIGRIHEELQRLRTQVQQGQATGWQQYHFASEHLLVYPDDRIIDNALAHIKHALSQVPTSMRLLRQHTRRNILLGRIQPAELHTVSLSDTLTYLSETFFIAPIQEQLHTMPRRFKRIYHEVQDAIRLVSFGLGGMDAAHHAQLAEVLDKGEQRILAAATHLQALRQQFDETLTSCLQQTLGLLEVPTLVAQSEQLRRNMRSEQRLQGIRLIYRNQRERLRALWERAVGYLGRTHAGLVRAGYEARNPREQNVYTRWLDFQQRISPDPAILDLLPFYYKQLYTGTQTVGRSLVSNRNRELLLAQRAIDHLRQRTGGGMLVVGAPLSGKTYFCENIAEHLLPGTVYRIDPPAEGSASEAQLVLAFQEAFRRDEPIEQLIESAPASSVFLFDDIERWWERQDEGHHVLLRIFGLIRKFGDEHLFLASCNPQAFDLFSRLYEIDAYFIHTFSLSPFGADDMRRVLLNRHASSGLTLVFDDTPLESLSLRERNRFFGKVHHLSGGCIGYALRLWLSMIRRVEEGSVYVHAPDRPEAPPIDRPDWLVLLAQVVLHKRMSFDKLGRIYAPESVADLRETVYNLCRAGLLHEIQEGLYEIEPYVYPYVVQHLRNARLF